MSRARGTRSRMHGFTLVEMLVVIVIIGILASLALAGLFASQEAARRSRTEGIIGTLNNQMAVRWESYRTRRLPVSPDFRNYPDAVRGTTADLQEVAVRQLIARRQLMRIELPDRWWDVAFDDNALDSGTYSNVRTARTVILRDALCRVRQGLFRLTRPSVRLVWNGDQAC